VGEESAAVEDGEDGAAEAAGGGRGSEETADPAETYATFSLTASP